MDLTLVCLFGYKWGRKREGEKIEWKLVIWLDKIGGGKTGGA